MLGRKSLLIIFSQTITQIFIGIIYLIAVKIFPSILFGYQKYVLSYMGIFLLISSVIFATPHLKIMAEQENNKIDDSFTIFVILSIFLIIFASLIIFLFFFILINFDVNLNNYELKSIFFLLYVQNLLISINSIFLVSFRARMNVAITEIPQFFGSIIQFIISLIAIILCHNFLLFISGSIIFELIKLIFFLSKNYFHFKFNFDRLLLKKYLRLGSIFVIPELSMTLSVNLGPLFLLRYANADLLGIYAVITNFFGMILTICSTFLILLIPNLTELLLKDKKKELFRLMDIFEKYMTILCGIIIIIFTIYAKFILTILLGNIYYERGVIIFFGNYFFLLQLAIYTPYIKLLMVNEKLKIITLIYLLHLIFAFFSWIFLIPSLNIIGIDFGGWIAFIFCSIIIRNYSQRNFGVGKFSIKGFIHLVSLLFIFFICNLINLNNFSFINSGLILIIILCFYGGFLFLIKIIEKNDIVYILDTISMRKMKKYIESELKTN